MGVGRTLTTRMQTSSLLVRVLVPLLAGGLGAAYFLRSSSAAPTRASSSEPVMSAKVVARPSPEAARPASEAGVQAPLAVRFDDEARRLSGEEWSIGVSIDVRVPMRFPVSLQVTLPRGATPVEGALSEQLTLDQVGTVRREFRFRAAEAPGVDNPVRVVLHGAAPDRSMGVHADRAFPPRPEATVPVQAAPRVMRPPAPVRP